MASIVQVEGRSTVEDWQPRKSCHQVVIISGVHCMNEVSTRQARLVLGWVIVFGPVYNLGI